MVYEEWLASGETHDFYCQFLDQANEINITSFNSGIHPTPNFLVLSDQFFVTTFANHFRELDPGLVIHSSNEKKNSQLYCNNIKYYDKNTNFPQLRQIFS